MDNKETIAANKQFLDDWYLALGDYILGDDAPPSRADLNPEQTVVFINWVLENERSKLGAMFKNLLNRAGLN